MKLTTADLRNKSYGTGCGMSGNETHLRKSCLSNPIIIDYIDDYFNGEIYDVEIEDDELMGGEAKFSKLELDAKFFNTYFKFLSDIDKMDVEEYFEEYCNDWDIVKNDDGSIDELDRKNIICIVFSDIIGELGGSLRVESYGENSNLIEIESE